MKLCVMTDSLIDQTGFLVMILFCGRCDQNHSSSSPFAKHNPHIDVIELGAHSSMSSVLNTRLFVQATGSGPKANNCSPRINDEITLPPCNLTIPGHMTSVNGVM